MSKCSCTSYTQNVFLMHLEINYSLAVSSNHGCYSVFITPTVKLALQRSAYLRHHTPLKVGIFHQKKGVTQWSHERYAYKFYSVTFSTSIYDTNFLDGLKNSEKVRCLS